MIIPLRCTITDSTFEVADTAGNVLFAGPLHRIGRISRAFSRLLADGTYGEGWWAWARTRGQARSRRRKVPDEWKQKAISIWRGGRIRMARSLKTDKTYATIKTQNWPSAVERMCRQFNWRKYRLGRGDWYTWANGVTRNSRHRSEIRDERQNKRRDDELDSSPVGIAGIPMRFDGETAHAENGLA